MDETAREYLLRRAREETDAAGRAKTDATAALHREFARVYLERAEAVAEPTLTADERGELPLG